MVDDYYVENEKEKNFIIANPQLFHYNELVKILANTKNTRFLKVAFKMQARKQMMQMKTKHDKFQWHPFIIEPDICDSARQFINMNDIYLLLVSLLADKNNKTQCKNKNLNNNMFESNTAYLHQTRMREFRSIILTKLIDNTTKTNEYTIATSDLYKKLPPTKYKEFDNVQHVKAVVDHLESFGAVAVQIINKSQKSSGKGGNTKWCANIIRNRLTTIEIGPEEKESLKNFLHNHGSFARAWGAGWGSREMHDLRVSGW